MKKITILLFGIIPLIFMCCLQKQKYAHDFDFNNMLSTSARVWGFLKYYHPALSDGEINWDYKLLALLEELDTINNKKDFNNIITSLIHSLNECSQYTLSNKFDTIPLNLNKRVLWLNDTTFLSEKNVRLLKMIYRSKQLEKNYYVTKSPYSGKPEFKNDTLYIKKEFPSKNERLLALFRFWNAINYFYPHHDINDHSWDSLLNAYIPRFIEVKDTLHYHLNIREFACQLNDGHIVVDSWPLAWHFGFLSPPYKLRWIEGLPIIDRYFTDSLGAIESLNIGDIILKVNDVPVEEIIATKCMYYSFSNKDHFNRRKADELLLTPSLDSMKIEVQRADSVFHVLVKPYYLYELYPALSRENHQKLNYERINDSVGYINLEYLDVTEVDSVMNQLLGMNKIIIDIRNYPHGVLDAISKYLFADSTEYVRIIEPNIDLPGEFYHAITYKTGKSLDKMFKGKVIILVSEQTQSHAEFTAMCFQASPNVITVGSTTAGTDGNMTSIRIPGNVTIYFTGLGIEYPDGTPTQRVGLRIDYYINHSIEDIQQGRDPVLDFAIEQ